MGPPDEVRAMIGKSGIAAKLLLVPRRSPIEMSAIVCPLEMSSNKGVSLVSFERLP